MKAEDYFRASMGMPPRDKKKNSRENTTQNNYSRSRQESGYHGRDPEEPLIPKEYAEDVEFVETKDYSETRSSSQTEGKEVNYHESQVSDVEWTEIKTSGNK